MIKIMWKHRNHGGWECIGSYDDLRQATYDFEKYKHGVLNETGILKLITDDEDAVYSMFFGTDEEMAGEQE